MAFTLEQLSAIEEAIASGALEVKYIDRSVKYNSLTDLLRARDLIRAGLGMTDPCNGRRYANYNKGL